MIECMDLLNGVFRRIFTTDSSVGKTFRLEMFLRIYECRLSMALVV